MPPSANFEAAAKSLQTFFRDISAFEESLLLTSRRLMLHVAEPLVAQMGIADKSDKPIQLLDLACGTGIVTDLAHMRLQPTALGQSTFIAGDLSEPMVGLVKKRIAVEGWVNTETKVMDAKVRSVEMASMH
jgi:ubiquinone/menaquinone biosynthesis C-methylase UbiE